MRLVLFFIGFFCFVTGCTYFILYLNLLTMGYSIFEFINQIILGYPGIMLFIGLFLLIITIIIRKEERR